MLTKLTPKAEASKTQHFSSLKINLLMMFNGIIPVCSENHTKPVTCEKHNNFNKQRESHDDGSKNRETYSGHL
jgi:hypothetical protein